MIPARSGGDASAAVTASAIGPDADDLVVSGGGQFAVATEELSAQAAGLRLVEEEAQLAAARLRSLQVAVDPGLIVQAPAAYAEAVEAAFELDRAAVLAGELDLALRLSAEAYGMVERTMIEGVRLSASVLGNVLGHLAPLLLVMGAPFLATTGLGVLAALAVVPGGPKSLADVGEWMRQHPQLANNPAVAGAVRLLFSSSDDVIAGLLGAPPGSSAVVGDEGLGLFGLREASGLVLTAAGAMAGASGGRLVETAVHTTAVSQHAVTAPRSLGDLAGRMPATSANGAQIRIEEYPSETGGSSWIVYLGGTVDMGALPQGEAFDMTSNVQSMSGGDGASYRAALEAMRDAGIKPGDPVFEVGYSQGGLLAVQLEQSKQYNVQGVLTLGSPVGQFETDAPTLTISHTEDLVPALGGLDSAAGDDRVFVRRTLFDDAPLPLGDAFPAHALGSYQDTAGLADQSSDPRVKRFVDSAAPFLSGGDGGVATDYRAKRVIPK